MPTRSPRHHILLAALSAFALVLICHSWQLGTAPLSATEGHRALPASLMATTGDWLVPRFYNEAYLRKPPMHFWVLASLSTLTDSQAEWVWRLPSVIGAALCAALMALFAGRWFGRIAAWCAGLGFIGLVSLWPGSRSADIDSLHILATAVGACCLIEVGFGSTQRRWLWGIGATLAITCAVLLKAHAGLPLLVGVLVGGSIINRRFRWLLHPAVWLPFVVAAGALAAWWWQVHLALEAEQTATDVAGTNEVAFNVFNLARIGTALLKMLPQLFLFALPLAACVIVLPTRTDHASPRITKAILASILVAWIILVLNGITNPRYGYSTMPMWCLLFGAVCQAWHDERLSNRAQVWLRQVGTVVSATGALALVLHLFLLDEGGQRPTTMLVLACISGSVGVAFWMNRRVRNAAIITLVTICLLTFPVAAMKTTERQESSGLRAARTIQRLTPDNTTITTLSLPRAKPEMLFYAQRDVHVLPREDRTPHPLAPGTWCVFTKGEWQTWRSALPGNFAESIELKAGDYTAHLARFR